MKTLIRFEEAALFILSIFLFAGTGYRWWWFPVLLLVPDFGMIGYAVNSKIGAAVYNTVHHRALSVVLYVTGAASGTGVLALAGIMLFAHSTMDRVFGYGLKYSDAFKHTHLD